MVGTALLTDLLTDSWLGRDLENPITTVTVVPAVRDDPD